MDLEETVLEKVFTEVGETVDAKVNKLTAKCISSENDTFSLDSEGNLLVNSITTRTNGTGQGISVDTIYPIGSIYLSVTDTNPSTLFGGVWEQIKDKFLLGSGDSHANGTIGGSETHAHTMSHSHTINSHSHVVPSHTHGHGNLYAKLQNTGGKFRIQRQNVGAYTTEVYVNANAGYFETKTDNVYGTQLGGWIDETGTYYTFESGVMYANDIGAYNSGVSSTMPPYLTVYMWKRVS